MKITMKIYLSVLFFLVLLGSLEIYTYVQATGNEISEFVSRRLEINGCVARNGLLFIIGQGSKRTACHKEETPLTWNIQGVKGDTGAQGLQGIQGVQGLKGDKGDRGDQGLQGLQGIKGDKGDTGQSASQLKLYDVNGQFLGNLFQIIFPNIPQGEKLENYLVYNPAIDALLSIDESGALGSTDGVPVLNFATPDCSGQAYSSRIILDKRIVIRTNRIFRSILPVARQSFRTHSILGGVACEQGLIFHSDDVGYPIQEITLPFTLPLQTPLQLKNQ